MVLIVLVNCLLIRGPVLPRVHQICHEILSIKYQTLQPDEVKKIQSSRVEGSYENPYGKKHFQISVTVEGVALWFISDGCCLTYTDEITHACYWRGNKSLTTNGEDMLIRSQDK